MSGDRYDVFITELTGEPETVSAAIAEAFDVSIAAARRTLLSLPTRVKGEVSLEDARRMEEALVGAGAVVLLRKRGASIAPAPLAPPPSPPPPPRSAGAPTDAPRARSSSLRQ